MGVSVDVGWGVGLFVAVGGTGVSEGVAVKVGSVSGVTTASVSVDVGSASEAVRVGVALLLKA
jgi:hypothetical protein